VLLGLSAALAATPLLAVPPQVREARLAEARLDNGLRVVVGSIPGSQEVALAVAYGAGSAFEEDGRGGLAHLVEHLSFHGTGELGSRDWSREAPLLAEIEELAEASVGEARKGEEADFAALAADRRRLAELVARQRALAIPQGLRLALTECGASRHTASTARDFVVYQTLLAPGALECALAVEARRMEGRSLRGFFDEQGEVLAELAEHARDPAVALVEAAARETWPGHPYGRGNWGEARQIRLLTPGDAEAFYRRLYDPANAVVAVVGDVGAEEALRAVGAAFAAIAAAAPPPRIAAVPPAAGNPTAAPTDRLVSLAGPGDGAWIGVGWRWPPRRSPDLPALRVLSAVLEARLRGALADGPSPLAAELDVQEWAAGGAAGGLTLIRARVRRAADLAAALSVVDRQLADLRRGPVAGAELEAARRRTVGGVQRVLGQPALLARELAVFALQTGRGESLTDLPGLLSSVDAGDVERAARLYLDPAQLIRIQLLPGG